MKQTKQTKQTYLVVVRRANGRFVKELKASSKYEAKRLRNRLLEKYDETFSVEVEVEQRANRTR